MRIRLLGRLAVVNIILCLCFFRAHRQARPDDLIWFNGRDEKGQLIAGEFVDKGRIRKFTAAEIVEVAPLSVSRKVNERSTYIEFG
jgi:hypothetical protein